MKYRLFMLALTLFIQACSTGSTKPPDDLLSLNEAQMKIRSYQTRVFDVNDQHKTLQAVVSSLMDLGFIVERVNTSLGIVTAAKFAGDNNVGFVEATVMVKPKGESQTEIRANALFNTKPIEDPKIYQDFFSVVQKSLFTS